MKKSLLKSVVCLMAILFLTAACAATAPTSAPEPPEEFTAADKGEGKLIENPPKNLPKLPAQYRSVLRRYEEDFLPGIKVGGDAFKLDTENSTFSFTLKIRRTEGGEVRKFPISGTYVNTTYDDFWRNSWGGISLVDGGKTLVICTKGSAEFISADTLRKSPMQLNLKGYSECWVLGVCEDGEEYIAILAEADIGYIVWFDKNGEPVKTAEISEQVVRLHDYAYYSGRDYYDGLAFIDCSGLETIHFDNPEESLLLLSKTMHSGWAAYGDVPEGELFTFTMLTRTGELIVADERFFYQSENGLYTLLEINNQDSPFGFAAMYREDEQLKSAFFFPGPPPYYYVPNEYAQWTFSGKTAEMWLEQPSRYFKLDFENMTGFTEYRFTAEDLEHGQQPLAASPDGRYTLHAANVSGMGDGYWGQVVLIDSFDGSIKYVTGMPVQYGSDSNATNFINNTAYTTADGRFLRIYSVTEPAEYRSVILELPGDRTDVIYANSFYDIANDRYLLVYAGNVDVFDGGWHNYDNAVYHVAVFDSELKLVGDITVPELEITYPLYGRPCPAMSIDGDVLMLENIPVKLSAGE